MPPLHRLVAVVSGVGLLTAPWPTLAQLTPDATLGTEASLVSPGVELPSGLADLIEGGAIRGGNLFHSFLEFNVDLGQRVYFANPAGVESILSRVTGGDLSNIFGTLGVDGAADLFLINPNGIVFGENASLDIQGSFYATTAEGIPLGEGVYSATAPEQSSLLTVDPSALFSSYLSDASGDIENRGQLAAQGNMTLAGNNLDLQGQVAAGGDLTLLGNAVQIRDAVDTPFVGFAGGDLLVQGNEGVDIVALSHPDSGLYSYGDMVLRSANQVGGDAHYWSGGSFRVESLAGEAGDLFSPVDPIIRTFGDVEIGAYQGSSLHILAGGAVRIGTALITQPDAGAIGVDFLRETIQLSDGTTVEIDGGTRPTLDVRAGVSPDAIGLIPLGNSSGVNPAIDIFFDEMLQLAIPSIGDAPSSADIEIGDGVINAANGLVLLTNQYQPNPELEGNISITGDGVFGFGLFASGVFAFGGQGGAVYLDARNDVSVINSFIDTTGLGVVGDVVVNADGTVRFDGTDGSRLTGAFANIDSGGEGTGGDVRINSANLEVLNGAQINAAVFGTGQGGNVALNIEGLARFEGSNSINGNPSGAFSSIAPDGVGTGGDVQITAGTLEVLNGAQLDASTFGQGDAGNVILVVEGLAHFEGTNPIDGRASGAFSAIAPNGVGTGGDVQITAGSLEVLDGAVLGTGILTFGQGVSGSVILVIDGLARFAGTNPDGISVSGAFSRIAPNGLGRGGDVQITAGSLEVLNGSQLGASTFGQGDAGSVILVVEGLARFAGNNLDGSAPSGAFSRIETTGLGRGGNIQITADTLQVIDGAQLSASTFGQGDAGSVILVVEGLARFEGSDPIDGSASGAFSSIQPNGLGAGGDVQLTAGTLEVLNGAQLVASTLGEGDAGNVILVAEGLARFEGTNPIDSSSASGAFSSIQPDGVGQGGDVQLTAQNVEVSRGAVLGAASLGRGDAGNILLIVPGQLLVNGGTIEANAEVFSGGQVSIQGGSVILRNDGDIQTFVGRGEGGGGNITIAGNFVIALDDSDILAFSADGQGGDIDLSRTTFFGQNANIASGQLSREELLALDGNDRIDVNATGGVASGQITLNDSSFIENSLTNLADVVIDTAALTAGSCIARTDESLGSFTVTGSGGLPQRPGDSAISAYPTGTVQTLPTPTATHTLLEPDGVYQLPDGRLVLSRACEEG